MSGLPTALSETLLGVSAARGCGGETALATAHATADESKGIIELQEDNESEVLEAQAQKLCIGCGAAEMAAHATAGESQRIIGLRVVSLTFHLLIHLGVWVLLHVLVCLLCLVCFCPCVFCGCCTCALHTHA